MYFSARTHVSYSCPSKRKSMKSPLATSVLHGMIYTLSLESHNWISEWNSRRLPKGIAAVPLLLLSLPAERKKQTLKVSEKQSRYIVSSKIEREIISRWFDVLCTGSFCRYRHRSNNFAEGVNFRPFSLPTNWGANWKLNDRPNGIWPSEDMSLATLRWDSGAGIEKRHSEKAAKQSKNTRCCPQE